MYELSAVQCKNNGFDSTETKLAYILTLNFLQEGLRQWKAVTWRLTIEVFRFWRLPTTLFRGLSFKDSYFLSEKSSARGVSVKMFGILTLHGYQKDISSRRLSVY